MVNVHSTELDVKFILGCLNSDLIRAYWLDKFYDQRRTFPKIKGTYLKELPIRNIKFSDPSESASHDLMVSLVDQMLQIQGKLVGSDPATHTVLQRQIGLIEYQINALVYKLYHITANQISSINHIIGEG